MQSHAVHAWKGFNDTEDESTESDEDDELIGRFDANYKSLFGADNETKWFIVDLLKREEVFTRNRPMFAIKEIKKYKNKKHRLNIIFAVDDENTVHNININNQESRFGSIILAPLNQYTLPITTYRWQNPEPQLQYL